MHNIVSTLPSIAPAATISAVALSLVFFTISERARKRALTIDLWKTWASKDYRNYRVTANRAIKRAKAAAVSEDKPLYSDLIQDQQIEDAIGSLEHYFFELASIKQANLLDEKLFSALFYDSAISWRDIFSGFNREDADTFSEAELDLAFTILLGDHRLLATKYFSGRSLKRGHGDLRREGIIASGLIEEQ